MTVPPRQGDLFAGQALAPGGASAPAPPPLLREQLLAWQARLAAHQHPLFAAAGDSSPSPVATQGALFPSAPLGRSDPVGNDPTAWAERFDPLSLRPQSLSFWRWPQAPHRGAALYLVTDRPSEASPPLLLYVGETGSADRRWKGEHDCKAYLAAYREALVRASLAARLSIRFCCDVPTVTRTRRALEQALIRRWLPPFNKETRDRWTTPFTAEPL